MATKRRKTLVSFSTGLVTPTGYSETTIGAALGTLKGRRTGPYASGARVLSQVLATSGTNAALTQTRIFYVPAWFPELVISGLAIYEAAGGTAQNCRLGVYAPHATTGLPDALLGALTAELSMTGSAGERTGSFATNITLPETPVWIACASGSSGAANIMVGAAQAAWQHLIPNKTWTEHITGTAYKGVHSAPGAYAALAATANLTSQAFTSGSIGVMPALVVA